MFTKNQEDGRHNFEKLCASFVPFVLLHKTAKGLHKSHEDGRHSFGKLSASFFRLFTLLHKRLEESALITCLVTNLKKQIKVKMYESNKNIQGIF